MKYILRKEIEHGAVIYSVLNAETKNRVNYFDKREDAEAFISRLNL